MKEERLRGMQYYRSKGRGVRHHVKVDVIKEWGGHKYRRVVWLDTKAKAEARVAEWRCSGSGVKTTSGELGGKQGFWLWTRIK